MSAPLTAKDHVPSIQLYIKQNSQTDNPATAKHLDFPYRKAKAPNDVISYVTRPVARSIHSKQFQYRNSSSRGETKIERLQKQSWQLSPKTGDLVKTHMPMGAKNLGTGLPLPPRAARLSQNQSGCCADLKTRPDATLRKFRTRTIHGRHL